MPIDLSDVVVGGIYRSTLSFLPGLIHVLSIKADPEYKHPLVHFVRGRMAARSPGKGGLQFCRHGGGISMMPIAQFCGMVEASEFKATRVNRVPSNFSHVR